MNKMKPQETEQAAQKLLISPQNNQVHMQNKDSLSGHHIVRKARVGAITFGLVYI